METKKIIAAGVLPICFNTKRALLSKRHPHVMYGDTWASWGGKFEKEIDSTPQSCAKREFWEETRIDIPYHFVEEPIHIYEDERVIYYTFLGFFDIEVVPDILTEGGLAGQGWFSLEELPENLMPEFGIMMGAKMDMVKKMMNDIALTYHPQQQYSVNNISHGK